MKIAAARPFPYLGRQGRNQKGARRRRHPATGEEVMQGVTNAWGEGEGVAWIGLVLTFLIWLKASEMCAADHGRVYAVYCLRGGNVVF